jgi:putative membrane protein
MRQSKLRQSELQQSGLSQIGNWLLRFVKGIIIGISFILPGISGGALAAVFGLYERIINFIAHITKDFWINVLFFIPVGLGGLFGIFAVARPLNFILSNYETWCLWFFIGLIAGTLPDMWKTAGKLGRKKYHYIIFGFAFLISLVLFIALQLFKTQLEINYVAWIICGAVIALSILIPGMASSVLLIILGLYQPLVEAFSNFAIVPLLITAAAALVCLFAFSSVVSALLKKAYTGMSHIIMGIVIASTMTILPVQYDYYSTGTLVCIIVFLAGAILGFCVSKLG